MVKLCDPPFDPPPRGDLCYLWPRRTTSVKIIYSEIYYSEIQEELLDFLLLEWIFFSYIQKLEKIRSVHSIHIEDVLNNTIFFYLLLFFIDNSIELK